MREVSRLIDAEQPAWPELREIRDASQASLQVLRADNDLGRPPVLPLQVTARSYRGAMVPKRQLLAADRDACRQFEGVDPGFLGAL